MRMSSIIICTTIFAVTIGLMSYVAVKMTHTETVCYGSPYLYVTTHDEVRNILKFSRNGCYMGDEVLLDGPIMEKKHFTELRSMAIGQYRGEKALYLADASSFHSALHVYSDCDKNGQRKYLDTVVETEKNPGANHIYGIAFDNESNIYVSSQHTDNVLRFYKDTFKPMPLPDAAQVKNEYYEHFEGTFLQFGLPREHVLWKQGIRSIARVHDDIWIASEDYDGIVLANIYTGRINNIIRMTDPIGLHYDPKLNLVFVSSKRSKHKGAVYSIDPITLAIVNKYKTSKMTHPTGVVTYDDHLFVAEQQENSIYRFKISKPSVAVLMVPSVPGVIEQLTISEC